MSSLLNGHYLKHVEDFRQLISPKLYAAKDCSIRYIGVNESTELVLHRARVFFEHELRPAIDINLTTPRIKAGAFKLSDLDVTIEDFLDECIAGKLLTPDGSLHILGDKQRNGEIEAYLNAFHQYGEQKQQRLSVLKIRGRSVHQVQNDPSIAWELRSAQTPFTSMAELESSLGVSDQNEDKAFVEFVAFPCIMVSQASTICNGTASIIVEMIDDLDPKNVTVGIIENARGKMTRFQLKSDEFDWVNEGERLMGVHKRQVTRNENIILQCFVNYNDVAYHYWYVADPSLSENARAIAYEAFDEKQSELKSTLFESAGNAKAFELAVLRLLWLLGFEPVSIDLHTRINNAPDGFMIAKNGDILVLEATTGTLKSGDKLANLQQRAALVRKKLLDVGRGDLKVLPCIVSALSSEEIEADAIDARSKKVVVVTKSDLQLLFEQTLKSDQTTEIYEAMLESINFEKS